MDGLAEEDRFSGVVLVAKDGKVLLGKAYGLADRDKGVPNKPDTKFNLGSVGKTFTGVAIAQLAQEVKLSFDDPVGKYVSGLPADIAGKVTIEHLLTHTSGLGDFMTPEYHANKDNVRTIPEFMQYAAGQPLRFKPGTAHLYSNAGYVLLGAVIESVSGKSYYDYVRERVFEPAGMKDTDFYEKDADTPNLARGFHPAGMPRTSTSSRRPGTPSSSCPTSRKAPVRRIRSWWS
jgi:CubicO group peptidase (beta-lactamase class C family)